MGSSFPATVTRHNLPEGINVLMQRNQSVSMIHGQSSSKHTIKRFVFLLQRAYYRQQNHAPACTENNTKLTHKLFLFGVSTLMLEYPVRKQVMGSWDLKKKRQIKPGSLVGGYSSHVQAQQVTLPVFHMTKSTGWKKTRVLLRPTELRKSSRGDHMAELSTSPGVKPLRKWGLHFSLQLVLEI